MAILVKYGSFTHDVAEAAVAIARRTAFNAADQPISITTTITVNGFVVADGNAAVEARVAAIKAAYASQGQDFRLTLASGATGGTHELLTANCLGGVKVIVPPSFPDLSGGGAMNTGCDFTVTLEGEEELTSPPTLVSFTETVQFTGTGGPMRGHIETLTGAPVKQTWRQQTVYRASQSGRAVGYNGYPAYPNPIWPAAEIEPSRIRTPTSPRRRGSVYREYPINWSYTFESATPLTGAPHLWT